MSSQFLNAGAVDGVSMFIGLNQKKSHFVRDMKGFGIDFEKLEAEARFVYVDSLDQRKGPEPASGLTDVIRSAIKKYSPKRIVVDSISDLVFRYPKPEDRLPMVLDLIEMLQEAGATSLLTIELKSRGAGGIQPEEYLADGIVLLRTGSTGTRVIQVLKMRGVKIVPKPKPYEIIEDGIEVYVNEEFLQ
jgi:KaiC/GvpD/RAD55 family RecA-like ATPase